MSNPANPSPSTPTSSATRRDFIAKTGTAAAAVGAASTIGFPSVTFGQEDKKKLKIGLIGCGGRGTGAVAQALSADDNVELHAMGDAFEDKAMLQLRVLARDRKSAAKIGADVQSTKNIFGGLDAYQKVMDSGVDVVLLTTPPGFRPQHFKEAVDRGIHCFVEKPCASDVHGVMDFIETGKKAAEKGVSVLAGLCYRYSDHGRELYEERIPNGDIGDIISYHATYFANIVKPMQPPEDRPAGMSDSEWQIRNWYNFAWLSGDGFVEQAIHNVDKMAWVIGQTTGVDLPKPIACYAQGGRQRPNHEGNTYDHYSVCYEWENNLRVHIDWSQYGAGVYKENKDYIYGTKGMATYDINNAAITGEKAWQFRKPRTGMRNMYQTEHDEFFASIRKGERHADEAWVAHSTLLAIMARHAAYTGKRITWEDVINSNEKLVPDTVSMDAELPIRPMAIPGVAETQSA
ncbi:MAG: Gfo/Idh/MocA family oxidoreductase [Verrucomicrobiae bacterium]|nr:Gfo/Idh/MocA family oxidoreductase [Verrucomicrobiae bacterium]